MGYLKQKYTKEYYTGKNSKGIKLPYGAEAKFDRNGNWEIRNHDRYILNKINFTKKRVLSLGCGRGEEFVFAIKHKAMESRSYAVDFSPSAIEIAKKTLRKEAIATENLIESDALIFISDYVKKFGREKDKYFDVVLMFDFIEHVPRNEMESIIRELTKVLTEKSILVINTPAYKYDNDVIKNGYDNRNQINCLDKSDVIDATKGMHCNKYSVVSLQNFMSANGYLNITEAHFFIKNIKKNSYLSYASYLDRWNYCYKNSYSIVKSYSEDKIESPYKEILTPDVINFKKGNLKGISLLLTKKYQKIAFPHENVDSEVVNDILQHKPSGKTIIDVGAFIGSSSLVFSKLVGPKGRVVSFEPNPFNLNRSFVNLSLNPSLSSNIRIYPYALAESEKNGIMILSQEVDNGYSSTSRLEQSHSKIHLENLPEGFEEFIIETIKFDSFVNKYKLNPDIIKVDIEGAEHGFLLGSIDTIKKYSPVIYLEIHSEFCAIRCLEILHSLNYTVTVLKEEKDNRIMIKANRIFLDGSKREQTVKRRFSDNLFKNIWNTNRIDREIINIKNDIESLTNEKLRLVRIKEEYRKKNQKLQESTVSLVNENINYRERNEFQAKEVREAKELNDKVIKENMDLLFWNKGLQEENRVVHKSNENLIGIINSMENSNSWKLTKPIRLLREHFNRVNKKIIHEK